MLKNIIIVILYFFILSSISKEANAQSGISYMSDIKDNSIHTLNVYSRNDKNTFPIIRLNSKEKIHLNFDYFDTETQQLYYEIRHCDVNWNDSKLSEYKFMKGFSINYIENPEISFNTNIEYANYNLELPNDDISFKISGNYKIIVYKNENKSDTLFISKFMILENVVLIKAKAHQASLTRYMDKYHEVDFSIDYSKANIFNPGTDIKAIVWQNGNINNKIELKPLFINGQTCSYDYNEENLFKAGNEFRYFNCSNKNFASRYVEFIDKSKDTTEFTLRPDKNHYYERYNYKKDINGNYRIYSHNSNDPNLDSDYVYVNFSLKMKEPLKDNVYVYGKISNWNIRENFKMKYNLQFKAYTLKVLLKQGYYNYQYVNINNNKIVYDTIEGSFSQTENNYHIAIYKYDNSLYTYKLVGFKQINNSLINN